MKKQNSKNVGTKVNIRPVGKRVLVTPLKLEEVSASGIIIPDSARKEKPAQGTVRAIGESVEGIAVGDTVIFTKYGFSEITVADEEYYVVNQDDVLVVIQ
jgi:chaperonin GroES